MKKILILISLLLMLGCFSDKSKKEEFTEEVFIDDGKTEITFMLYMAADTDLNGTYNNYLERKDNAKFDLEEIRKANYSQEVNVVVFGDFLHDESNTPGIFYKTNNNTLEKVKSIEEPNTGEKETLKDFLDYTKEKLPAKKYILSIWGHGDGWLDDKYGNSNNPKRAIGEDYSSGKDYLDLWEIEDAINESNIENIDMIFMDSCYMGTIEVASQFKENSDYFIASPEKVPGRGADYERMLNYLRSHCDNDMEQISSDFVDIFGDSYMSGGRQESNIKGYNYYSLSAVDQSIINELEGKIKDIVPELIENIDIINEKIEKPENYSRSYFIDFGDFFKKISKIENLDQVLKNEVDNILEILDHSVINVRYRNGTWKQDFTTGFSIYGYDENHTDEYLTSNRFSQNTNWLEFIKLLDIKESPLN